MRTLEEVVGYLAYHPATPEVAVRYNQLRELTIDLASEAWDLIPDGPDKTTAFRRLHEFLMYANLANALTTPVDRDNAAVARVLPDAVGDVAGVSVAAVRGDTPATDQQ